MIVDLSCRDWRERLRDHKRLINDNVFARLDSFEVELAVGFYNALHLPDVPGLPLMLHASGEWFRDIIRVLFGSLNRTTMERFVEEVFVLVPKKNSKTTNGAALMLTALLMNMRPRAEFLNIGATQAVSDLAFSQTVGMIEADQELKKRFQVREHLKEVKDRLNGSKLRVKSFDLDILTGPRPAGTLLDEVHLLGKNPHAAKIIRQIRGGRQATPEGFFVMLTTQSDDQPAGVFLDELSTARKIRDGEIPGTMLPVLYEFPEEIVAEPEQGQEPKWYNSAIWPMVLPNLGKSLRLDSLIADFNTERAKGDKAIQLWASQHLDVEIGAAIRSSAWAGIRHWQKCTNKSLTLANIVETSEIVVVGLDGGGLDDLFGMAVIGRHKVTKKWQIWLHAWVHESVLKLREDIAPALQDFERDGDVTIIKRVGDDVEEMGNIVDMINMRRRLPWENAAVGVDPIGINEAVDELSKRNIDMDRIAGVPQGYKLNSAIKTLERKLAGNEVEHPGQRLAAWCVSNAKVEQRGNAILITKQVSGTAKIDPLIAAFNAVSVLGTHPETPKSKYEEGGLLTL